jgi:Haem degrading protein HbpS-like
MNKIRSFAILAVSAGAVLGALALTSGPALAASPCAGLPSYGTLKAAAQNAVAALRSNGVGLGNEAWATVVNRDGIVCAVAFTGHEFGDQWPGSRVISAQKANTANAFSLPGGIPGFAGALSSGNLYGVVLEQGSLFGLQFSNPVDPAVAYKGPASRFGQANDPMVGSAIGGVNVFGGGLALYDSSGKLVGGLGMSGDTSCADHINAWRVRDALGLDNIPGGVGPNGTDNLNLADPVSPNQFQHPFCGFDEENVINNLQ